MVQGRSPEDTQEIDTKKVLEQVRSTSEEMDDVTVELNRKALVELLSDLDGDVVNIDTLD
jgi:hypothetical protein